VLRVETRGSSVRLSVHVQPRATRSEIVGLHGAALKVRLQAPPVDGAANEACVEFFAKSLKVRRSSVTIASGERNRLKVVRVAGVTAQQFWERLSSQ